MQEPGTRTQLIKQANVTGAAAMISNCSCFFRSTEVADALTHTSSLAAVGLTRYSTALYSLRYLSLWRLRHTGLDRVLEGSAQQQLPVVK